MILNPIDQGIRDQGFKFVPFNQYLASPFQMPQNQETTENARVSSGLPMIYQAQGGGGSVDNKNAFNIDDRGLLTTDFTNFEPNYSYTPPAYDDFPPQQNMFQKAFSGLKNKGAQIAGGLMSFATGIPFLGQGLQAISNQFESRPLGAAVIDEFGNVYNEDELNKMNALGGYYTDPARSARRRTNRINKMLERQRLGKKISLANLAKLQAQEKKQEEIRQAAAAAMQAQNRAEGRGGYQSNFAQDKDFMEGPSSASTGMGPSDKGGSDTMGSFMDGGIVDLVDIYD
tara:strand:- start:386 stop:1243 length:858 start_codon:yes stop_codon:yes gene_type:complete